MTVQQLPTNIKVGMTASWVGNGIVQIGDNEHERRFKRSPLARRKWTVEWVVESVPTAESMFECFDTTDAFLFLPQRPTDYRETGQVARNTVTGLGTGDGSTATFQMQITRSLVALSGTVTGSKNILHPTGTVNVYVSAVLKTLTTHYTYSTTTGIITFTAGNEPANAAIVTVDFDYYTAVRFMSDELSTTITQTGDASGRIQEVRQTSVIEVLDE